MSIDVGWESYIYVSRIVGSVPAVRTIHICKSQPPSSVFRWHTSGGGQMLSIAQDSRIKLSHLVKIIKFACHNKETNHFNVAECINILIDLGLVKLRDIDVDLEETQAFFAAQANLNSDDAKQ